MKMCYFDYGQIERSYAKIFMHDDVRQSSEANFQRTFSPKMAELRSH